MALRIDVVLILFILNYRGYSSSALIAQLGERQTEDLKALCSIHSQGTYFCFDTMITVLNLAVLLSLRFFIDAGVLIVYDYHSIRNEREA